MRSFGHGEAATHALSLLFALLADPGGAVGRVEPVRPRAPGWSARRSPRCNPFLTHYAQETRMYSLLALLAWSRRRRSCWLRVPRGAAYLALLASALAR